MLSYYVWGEEGSVSVKIRFPGEILLSTLFCVVNCYKTLHYTFYNHFQGCVISEKSFIIQLFGSVIWKMDAVGILLITNDVYNVHGAQHDTEENTTLAFARGQPGRTPFPTTSCAVLKVLRFYIITSTQK